MTTLILASASEIRSKLLKDSGIYHEISPARIDEEALRQSMEAEGASPRDIVDMLAEMKARRVSNQLPEGLVLGSDQILVADNKIISKTNTIEEARNVLEKLRGKAHSLLSAAVIYERNRPVWRTIGQAQLIMRDFSDSFLDEYIEKHGDDLLTTVGCYKLEDGPTLFTRVSGDYFSVLGLPLLDVLGFLRTRGIGTT